VDALRQQHQERAKRFLNAKNRSIGIDKSYLDKQVEEKRLRELTEKDEKLAEGELFTKQNTIIHKYFLKAHGLLLMALANSRKFKEVGKIAR
jgi:hypothetical protein